ncbi:aminotransferase class I/II-fold pyridoxal phosphate-dependent enzyme [Paenibacillus sp. Y412MC10]|uniref:aminotransferase class I/II-fold pyridoxal phosphate-dependent enzyme n=1 Tax=Geobacillus sp. (strain Y412MC10) TaxID=481743 RepID=UPI0011A25277
MKMFTGYAGWQEDELRREQGRLQAEYEAYQSLNLKLDMSRGKPCPEQLQLSNEMLDVLPSGEELRAEDGTDCRNYGGLDGIPEAKRFFAEMLGVQSSEVIVQGNSSLNLMYDALARAMLFGVLGSEQPWSKLPSVKFLCPSPGYDRHFAICEQLNIEMITVDMTPEGPDMDAVERLVAEDDSIKGIWCVPKYSNPGGITYSDETVERLARMKTRAGDFRIFWDDAYTVHHLTSRHDELKNMLEACSNAGNPDRVFIFASTSKVTFPGSGVAALAASRDNLSHMKKQLSVQTIGPDKVNQLRHIRFLKDMEHLGRHMEKHAAIIKPKFDLVLNKLESGIGTKDIASWSKPSGGYFISLDTMDGCAQEIVRRAAEAGVTLTPAGATYPYGRDPRDRNIRIAPTYPSLEELAQAIDILCVCVKLVSIDRILADQ